MESEQIINNIFELVKKLVYDHGMHQKQIYKKVTSKLIEFAKTQSKIQIMYNNKYGGFSYSEEFLDFYHGTGSNEDSDFEVRTGMVPHIDAFGKHLYEKYPEIGKSVMIYHMYNVKEKVYNCNNYRTKVDDVRAARANLDHLKRCIDDAEMTGTCNDWPGTKTHLQTYDFCYSVKFNNWNQFSFEFLKSKAPSVIEEYIQKESKVIEAFETMLDKEHERILAHLETKRNKNDFKHDRQTFANVLETFKNDIVDNAKIIWHHQYQLDIDTMIYITMNMDFYDTTKDMDDKTEKDVYRTLGLIGASGPYCNLAIAEVPEKLGWSIGEYDGLEHVYVP